MTKETALLRERGLHVTSQRTTLLRVLLEAKEHEHMAAKTLLEIAEIEVPGLNLSTVYRTLDGLHQVGLVDRLAVGPNEVLYSLHDPSRRHGHLVCRTCLLVETLDIDAVLLLARDIRLETAFRIDEDHLTLSGLCRGCVAGGDGA